MIHSIGKVSFAGIVVALLGSIPVRAQSSEADFVLSERVGPVIDAEERAYFGLFPGIDGFVAARPQAPSALTFRIVVERTGQPDTTLHVDPEVAEALGQYLDQFEHVYRDTRAVDWKYLYQVARAKPPFEPGMPLTITRTDGTVVKGQLVHIDEQGLLLTRAAETPLMLRDTTEAVWFSTGEIQEIRNRKRGGIFREIWLLQAGSEAMYGPHVLPVLETRAMLADRTLSPELRALVVAGQQQSTAAGLAPYAMAEPVEQLYQQRFSDRWHVAVRFHAWPKVPVISHVQDYSVSVVPGWEDEGWEDVHGALATAPIDLADYAVSIRLDVDLKHRVRAGLEVLFQERPNMAPPVFSGSRGNRINAAILATTAGTVAMGGRLANGWIWYRLKSARPHMFPYAPSRVFALDMHAGLGVSYGELKTQARLFTLGPTGEVFTDRQRIVGPAAALSMNAYVTRNLSVHVEARSFVFPGVEMPTWTVESRLSIQDRTLYGYTDTLVVFDIAIGLSVHFW